MVSGIVRMIGRCGIRAGTGGKNEVKDEHDDK